MTEYRSPSDAEVAIRSFPRRFRGALAPATDDPDRFDPDDVGRRVGAGGRSAVDHLLAADAVLALVTSAIELAAVDPDAIHDAATADLHGAVAQDPGSPVDALLELFAARSTACAERVHGISADTWGTAVQVAGQSSPIPLLDVLSSGVDAVAGHLRSAQRVLDDVT